MGVPGLGIYVHWPFCASKCPYCDFNSHVRDAIDEKAFSAALLAQLEAFAQLAPGRSVSSIFFGGGTPSLMSPRTAAAVMEKVATLWSVDSQVEVTMEANPSTAEASRFRDFRGAGIERLSLGVQALDDASLKFLGRRHSVAEALKAIELGRECFPRFSFDLIYARPNQTLSMWEQELGQALELTGDHLSAYQLTIEEGTAFAPLHARGAFAIPEDDDAADMFQLTQDMTEAAGLAAYEASNHARSGAACRHNVATWQGGDYIGIGPGAHGRLGRVAFSQHKAPEPWLELVGQDPMAALRREELDPLTRAEELVMLGLRLTEGIDRKLFAQTSGLELDTLLDPQRLSWLVAEGFVESDAQRVRVTPKGRLVLNQITEQVLV